MYDVMVFNVTFSNDSAISWIYKLLSSMIIKTKNTTPAVLHYLKYKIKCDAQLV